VDLRFEQGKGLGSGLLKDAMLRTLQAADIAGIRAIAVHAKDDDARAFYERFGFVATRTTCSCCSRTCARSSSSR
jgi:GNAT superfamily N-acetyltransferase